MNGYEGSSISEAGQTSNFDTYGVLYNYKAFITTGICPSGWHIPANDDWNELIDFLGGLPVAGMALKTVSGWAGGGGSNSSGFTALPGGSRYDVAGFNGYWWSSSSNGVNAAWTMCLYYGWGGTASQDSYNRSDAFSARCVRD